jgi:hypothetical protein
MTDKLDNETTSQKQDGGCSDCGMKSADVSRRKFTQATFAAPVLASLISAPAWGTACSISGAASNNLSGRDHDQCTGFGCTPGFWKTHPGAWCTIIPGAELQTLPETGAIGQGQLLNYIDPTSTLDTSPISNMPGIATAWSDVFDCPAPQFPTQSIMQVFLQNRENRGGFYFHAAAAIINAYCYSSAYGATPQQVIDFVNSTCGGTYEGKTFTQDEVHAVLEKMNERDCFLDSQGGCLAPPFPLENGIWVTGQNGCTAMCNEGYTFDPLTGTCVPNLV